MIPPAEINDPLLEQIDRLVPEPVREVCRVLQEDGHQALCVGGAVRDALLQRTPGDWDVATSALPEVVQRLFRRTIPTGIEHGTVTVMVGRGGDRHAVEVTTFRGEGAYSDARRPDTVTFGVALEDDLARRDFVVNAIAWDPVGGALVDPFGGRDDVLARRLRAVGDPNERFAEDGLRIVRAVRFVAVLDFELDPATERAITFALPSLAKVSRERVRVELIKLLGGIAATSGLTIAHRTGVLLDILPELAGLEIDAAIARVGGCAADTNLRAAALLLEVPAKQVDTALRRLTYSNADRDHVVGLVREAHAFLTTPSPEDAELRRALGRIGRGRAEHLGALVPQMASRLRSVEGDPLTAKDLAIGGADVIRVLATKPGPAIGRVIAALLERVLVDPSLNTREQLEHIVVHHLGDLTAPSRG